MTKLTEILTHERNDFGGEVVVKTRDEDFKIGFGVALFLASISDSGIQEDQISECRYLTEITPYANESTVQRHLEILKEHNLVEEPTPGTHLVSQEAKNADYQINLTSDYEAGRYLGWY